MSSKSNNLMSVGWLCQLFQRLPHEIAKAAKELDIEPAMVINGTSHYSGPQAERIRKHLAGNRRQRKAVSR